MRKLGAFLTAAVAASALGLLTAQSQELTTVGTATTEGVGTYITVNNTAVYLFMGDEAGQPPTCYDDCAAAWPPVLVGTAVTPEAAFGLRPRATGDAQQELLGTVARTGGGMQVTYNGWPLYYYDEDTAEGDVNGHEVEEFGAEWYLVMPDGEPVGG